jgi:hypothetical protein
LFGGQVRTVPMLYFAPAEIIKSRILDIVIPIDIGNNVGTFYR